MNLREVEKMALKYFKKHGRRIAQLMMCHANGEVSMHVLAFTNNEEKEEMIKMYRDLVTTKNITKYFMITEAWMATDNVYIRPSENKNRKEVLIIQEFRNDMFCQSIFHKFHRDGKKIVFDERLKAVHGKDTVEFNTIWNFYLEDVMKESMEKVYLGSFIELVGGKKKFDESMDKLEKMGMKMMNLTSDEDKKKLCDTAMKMIKEGRIVPACKLKDKIKEKEKEKKCP